jgi:hypothetical protein
MDVVAFTVRRHLGFQFEDTMNMLCFESLCAIAEKTCFNFSCLKTYE